TNGATPVGDRLRVLLAIFDFPLVTTGLRSVIEAEPGMIVAGEVTTHDDLRAAIETIPTDVVITECEPITAAGCTTFESIETIRSLKPSLRILALECRCGSEQFSLALKAGADGFLTREAQAADIVTALRCVARGETYVSPAIVTRMVNTYVLRTPGAPIEDAYDTLTEREKEVLLLAAVGHTNREIAKVFHLSEQTIHNYRASVMEKLDLHDRIDLLKFAVRRGIVDVADL
ncbi:MAG TPA: response regulator transcription factor, partial [Candidatus Limnocylindrales bacterium]|nr:response regulator transcription factor [Candidatus Limnocylindrales bacterium]